MVDDNNDDTGKHYDYEIRLTKRWLIIWTKIPELLNPSVNPVFCAANSRLVTKEGKLITLKEHQTQTR